MKRTSLSEMLSVNCLEDVEYHLYENARLFHLYSKSHPTPSFNCSGAGARRFDPIKINGKIVGSYYLAFHHVDAISETIMRKDTDGNRQFSIESNRSHGFSMVDILKPVILLDLNKIIGIKDILEKGKSSYSILNALARTILIKDPAPNPYFHGFIWDGYQRSEPGNRCVVFFDDRMSADDFKLINTEDLTSLHGYPMLLDASRALNCPVPPLKDILK